MQRNGNDKVKDSHALNQDLIAFLERATTPFHAVAEIARRLSAAEFELLDEQDKWSLKPGGRYFVIRDDASIVAFTVGNHLPSERGFRICGAHTDSPCLKVKPNPDKDTVGSLQISVEVYGGALLNPWFDRDLSLAGRVTFRDADRQIGRALIDFRRPVALIPSLAIHLDREVNKGRTVNPQTQMSPLLLQRGESDSASFRDFLKEQLKVEHPDVTPAEILDFEMSCYDVQSPAVVGMRGDYIAGARLDNLVSCYLGYRSLVEGNGKENAVLVCNDHEEVGSLSAIGAQGPFLSSVLGRVCGDHESYLHALNRSILLSVDNAHAVHPNFADKHDPQHKPVLNGGPVIKVNSNQRYATNARTATYFRGLCEIAGVPVQTLAMRSDMACGSTIGPITAGELGVATADVGIPQLAMHSAREVIGCQDPWHLFRALVALYDSPDPAP